MIDPWGVIGEVEFEIGASLRNPIDAAHLSSDPAAIQRRLRRFESTLRIDGDRALKWAFAMTVLAILWPFDQSAGIDLRAPFADAARSMYDLLGRTLH